VSAITFGLAPALRVARTQPGDILRDQSRSSTGGVRQMRIREWLVVSQVAMAFVLVVGAGLLLASFDQIRRVDLGVRPDNVLTFELNLPEARYDSTARSRFYEDLSAELATLPGVRAAGGVSKLPATGPYHNWGVEALTGPLANTNRASVGAQQRIISGDYLKVVGIPVIEGRGFNASDDVIGKGAAQRVFTLRILLTFASVAIALAALGLFGVLSYGVRLRAREFSIRMALGAEGSAIRRMILRRGMIVTGVGLLIGLAAATSLSKVMTSVLFKVSPFDPAVFVGAMAFMTLVGGLAAYLPARRATSADPREALQ
jgi:hypothetical protein